VLLGEISFRAGVNVLDELKKKVKLLGENYPNILRTRLILLIYTSLATPELVK